MIRGHPAEGLDHLLAELHRRRHRLRVPAQDVAEVDVEQFARSGNVTTASKMASSLKLRSITVKHWPTLRTINNEEAFTNMKDNHDT